MLAVMSEPVTTGNLNWGLAAGMYADTATAGTGLILTDTPWNGAYTVTPDVWVWTPRRLRATLMLTRCR